MSRTIKFRGKRFDNDGWVYGNLIIDDSGNCEIVDYENNNEIRYDVLGETIGQYTGLYDRNGREIYEGDIIESESTDMGSVRHMVTYYVGSARFAAILINKDMNNDSLRAVCPITQGWITKFNKCVIGNVYDNQELLKGSSNGSH